MCVRARPGQERLGHCASNLNIILILIIASLPLLGHGTKKTFKLEIWFARSIFAAGVQTKPHTSRIRYTEFYPTLFILQASTKLDDLHANHTRSQAHIINQNALQAISGFEMCFSASTIGAGGPSTWVPTLGSQHVGPNQNTSRIQHEEHTKSHTKSHATSHNKTHTSYIEKSLCHRTPLHL